MAPAGWPKPPQKIWLTGRVGSCAEARKHGRYGTWIISTYHDWFTRWPERQELYDNWEGPLTSEQAEALAEAIAERRRKIHNWFHNHRNRARETFTLPPAIAAELTKGKAKRLPHAREIYCRHFYGDDKKAIVQAELSAERARVGRPLTNQELMSITRTRIDAMFAAESDHIKEEVATKLQEEKAVLSAPPPAPVAVDTRTPQEYQNSIDSAPGVIEKLIGPVHKQTGWAITVTAAGPCPEEGGAIRSFAVHFGHNVSGHTLAQVTEDFRDKYIRPIVRFAKGVYSPEVRLSRALLTTIAQSDDDEDDAAEAGPSGTPSAADLPVPAPTLTPSTSQGLPIVPMPAIPAPPMGSVPSAPVADTPLQVLSDVAAASAPLGDVPGATPNVFTFAGSANFTFDPTRPPVPTAWNQMNFGADGAELFDAQYAYDGETVYQPPLPDLGGNVPRLPLLADDPVWAANFALLQPAIAPVVQPPVAPPASLVQPVPNAIAQPVADTPVATPAALPVAPPLVQLVADNGRPQRARRAPAARDLSPKRTARQKKPENMDIEPAKPKRKANAKGAGAKKRTRR